MRLQLCKEIAQQAGAMGAEGLIGGFQPCDAIGAKGAKALAHLAFGQQHQGLIHKHEGQRPNCAIRLRTLGISVENVNGRFVACGHAQNGYVNRNGRKGGLKLHPNLRLNSRSKRMLDQLHFCNQIGNLNQVRMGVASC